MVTDKLGEVKANIVILVYTELDFRDQYSDTKLWVVNSVIIRGNPRAEVKIQCRRFDC